LTSRAAISFRVASSASTPRAQIDTLAPHSAKASAMARPMPRLPPATMARLPVRSIFMKALRFGYWRESAARCCRGRNIFAKRRTLLRASGIP
jgi:hypothetical protein